MVEKPMYAYATRREDGVYVIVHNPAGIPVSATIEESETDFRMFRAGIGLPHLEHITLDISHLVGAGIISRGKLFGSAAR